MSATDEIPKGQKQTHFQWCSSAGVPGGSDAWLKDEKENGPHWQAYQGGTPAKEYRRVLEAQGGTHRQVVTQDALTTLNGQRVRLAIDFAGAERIVVGELQFDSAKRVVSILTDHAVEVGCNRDNYARTDSLAIGTHVRVPQWIGPIRAVRSCTAVQKGTTE